MTTQPHAPREQAPLVVDTVHELHADQRDPQQPAPRQNISVALLPLALVAFAVLVFVAAAWTFLAAS